MSILFRPIKRWPDNVPILRSVAPFRSAHRSTLGLINREVRMIDGRDAVVELALSEGQFTREGLHPDAGGDPEQWEMLQAAKTLLDDHHAIREARK